MTLHNGSWRIGVNKASQPGDAILNIYHPLDMLCILTQDKS